MIRNQKLLLVAVVVAVVAGIITREFIEFIFMEIQRVLVRHYSLFVSFFPTCCYIFLSPLSLSPHSFMLKSSYSTLMLSSNNNNKLQWKWNTRITMLLENLANVERSNDVASQMSFTSSVDVAVDSRWSMKSHELQSMTFSELWKSCKFRQRGRMKVWWEEVAVG